MGGRFFDLSKVNTVLFDFDGTLVDTNELISDTWHHTVKTLTGHDITEAEIRRTLGEILQYSMQRLMPEIDPEKAIDVYREYQRSVFLDRIKLFEGVEEVLSALRAAGHKTAIVTSRLRTSTEKALKHFNLYGLFDTVLTASDTKIFKPDPAPIYLILDMLGSKPEEAILVGDTKHDIEAGLAAGVFTVLVDWSYALPPENRANAPAPDAVIEKMKDLLTLLELTGG